MFKNNLLLLVTLFFFFSLRATAAENVLCSVMSSDLDPSTNDYEFIYQETLTVEPSHLWSNIQTVELQESQSLKFAINYTYEGVLRVQASFSVEKGEASTVLDAGFGTTSVAHLLDDNMSPPNPLRVHLNLVNSKLLNKIGFSGLFPTEHEILREIDTNQENLSRSEAFKASVSCEVQSK